MLWKLNISLYTLSPPDSRLSSRSSYFTHKTRKTVIQLQRQATLLKNLLKKRLNRPPLPSETAIDQIIKGAYISMYNATTEENASLSRANKKKLQKRTQSHWQIAHKEALTIAEGLQLAQQPE